METDPFIQVRNSRKDQGLRVKILISIRDVCDMPKAEVRTVAGEEEVALWETGGTHTQMVPGAGVWSKTAQGERGEDPATKPRGSQTLTDSPKEATPRLHAAWSLT